MNKILENSLFNILHDNRAISPMIATIMLIGIVVVMGAVIGVSTMKSASNLDTSYLSATLKAVEQNDPTNIVLVHDGGDRLATNMLTYSVTQGENSATLFEKMVFGLGYNYTIVLPVTDPVYFTAGDDIKIGSETDGIDDNGTAAQTPIQTGNVYHVVVRYDNKRVLLNTNMEII